VLKWGQQIGEDWNVSSINTIPVPKRKRTGIYLVYCSMLKNFKRLVKNSRESLKFF
jgi:hypothetical protein